jgi:penicillin-binding protein 1A
VAGKTGTTNNYGDAWFVGWTPQITTAVWVGFPNKLVPMTTLYNGGPVEGGTYPALIWHAFMTSALQILASEQTASQAKHHGNSQSATTGSYTATVPAPSAGSTATQAAPSSPAPSGTAPAPPAATNPAPATPAPPAGGGGGGTGGTGGTGGGTGGGGTGGSGGAGLGGGG